MEFEIADNLALELKKIGRKDKKLALKIKKQLSLFLLDHQHPSLRLHKLTGSSDELWSISVDMHTRMLFILHGREAVFFKIGSHDEVYRNS